MTVYNEATLQNIYTRLQAKEAFKKSYIQSNVYKKILTAHPVDLYTPNVFVKIGLGILTFFISLCTVGLVALLFDFNHVFGSFFIIMGIVCYAALEIITGPKKHYNSGVDNVLMAGTVLFISTGISFEFSDVSPQILSFVTCIISAWLAARFADRLAAIAATLSFLSFVFNLYVDAGEFSISSFPYLMIVVSGCIYYFSKRLAAVTGSEIYRPVWLAVSMVGLLAFCFSGNYYVVEKLTEEGYLLQKNSALTFPYFFWLWTMAFPVVCLVQGIRSKDIFLIRAGVLLAAVSVLTFRYYYSIIAAEVAMVIAGGLLLIISYLVMQYLRSPKHGFVFDNKSDEETENQNLEGFVIGQTFGGHHPPDQQTKFGGGNFGGAGSGSDY